MSDQRSYDIEIKITAYQILDNGEVTQNELRILRAFYPDILKEMQQQVEDDKE